MKRPCLWAIGAGAAALLVTEIQKRGPSSDVFSETDRVLAGETARWNGPEGEAMLHSLQGDRSPEVQAQMKEARQKALETLQPNAPRIIEIPPSANPMRYGPQGLARLIQETAKTHNLKPGDGVKIGGAVYTVE